MYNEYERGRNFEYIHNPPVDFNWVDYGNGEADARANLQRRDSQGNISKEDVIGTAIIIGVVLLAIVIIAFWDVFLVGICSGALIYLVLLLIEKHEAVWDFIQENFRALRAGIAAAWGFISPVLTRASGKAVSAGRTFAQWRSAMGRTLAGKRRRIIASLRDRPLPENERFPSR